MRQIARMNRRRFLKPVAMAGLGLAVLAQLLIPTSPALADQKGPASNAFVIQPEADQPAGEIGRGYFRLALTPGQTQDVRVVVKNTGAEPLTFRNDPVDGAQVAGSGVDYSTLGTPLTGVGTWLQVSPERLTLAPGEAQRVTATVRVPDSLSPGEYVGGIAVENVQVQSQGAGSNVLIDVHYRQVSAVLVTVPGPRTPGLEVGGVTLLPSDRGSQALVDLRNTGNVLVKGKGTLEIGGGQAQTGGLAFPFDSILPGAQARVVVALPQVSLKPGTYDVRVRLQAEGDGPLATWQGGVTADDPKQTAAAAGPDILLDPMQPLAATAQGLPVVVVWGGAGLLLVLSGGAAAVMLRRRRRAATPSGGRVSRDRHLPVPQPMLPLPEAREARALPAGPALASYRALQEPAAGARLPQPPQRRDAPRLYVRARPAPQDTGNPGGVLGRTLSQRSIHRAGFTPGRGSPTALD